MWVIVSGIPTGFENQPITPAQREYLASFEEWLHNPSDEAYLQRKRSLLGLLSEAGINPEYPHLHTRRERHQTTWLRDLVEETECSPGSRAPQERLLLAS
jgi:hypothetical protein